MKPGQYFSLVLGAFFLLIGLMGFIPGLMERPQTASEIAPVFDGGFGYLLGIFPVNVFNNAIYIVVGLLGIFMSIALDGSRVYSRIMAGLCGLLTIMGLFPYTNTIFGLMPIFGNDVWLNALTTAFATYFGFFDSPGLLELGQQNPQPPQNLGGA
jgi:hypothetical protein